MPTKEFTRWPCPFGPRRRFVRHSRRGRCSSSRVPRPRRGSCLVTAGATRVLCAVSLEDQVPDFPGRQGRGLADRQVRDAARSTHTRSQRRSTRGKIGGRTRDPAPDRPQPAGRGRPREARRRTLTVDCDVLNGRRRHAHRRSAGPTSRWRRRSRSWSTWAFSPRCRCATGGGDQRRHRRARPAGRPRLPRTAAPGRCQLRHDRRQRDRGSAGARRRVGRSSAT